ncbi:unnamed protein product [Linum trigynum]|uniref:Uncharacterized protein n=1 Tax=Linum trigynum TaxID=586398 RepID=A0AAV2GUC2_9ROSI
MTAPIRPMLHDSGKYWVLCSTSSTPVRTLPSPSTSSPNTCTLHPPIIGSVSNGYFAMFVVLSPMAYPSGAPLFLYASQPLPTLTGPGTLMIVHPPPPI